MRFAASESMAVGFQMALVLVGSVFAAGGGSLYRACLGLGGLTGGIVAGSTVAGQGVASGTAESLLVLVGGGVGVAVGVTVAYLLLRAVVAAAGFAAGAVAALGLTEPGLAAAAMEQPLHVLGRFLDGGVGGELLVPAAVGLAAGSAALVLRRRFFGVAATFAGAYLVSSGATGHGVSPGRGFLPVEAFYFALIAVFGLGVLVQWLGSPGLPLPGRGEEEECGAPERERLVLEAGEGGTVPREFGGARSGDGSRVEQSSGRLS